MIGLVEIGPEKIDVRAARSLRKVKTLGPELPPPPTYSPRFSSTFGAMSDLEMATMSEGVIDNGNAGSRL